MTEPVCDAKRPLGYEQCERPAGHEGHHLRIGDNGTVAWGLYR